MMRFPLVILLAAVAGRAQAELPPPSDAARAQAAEAAAKRVWSDKVAQYQTCRAIDRTVEAYQKELRADGKAVPTPVPTASCVDPGPYAAPAAPKPLEASGAHSPPETALGPPSSPIPAAEQSGIRK